MNARPSTPARHLLEQGGRWRETVATAVSALERAGERVGIDFLPCDEPWELINARANWSIDASLNPRFDPERGRLNARNYAALYSVMRPPQKHRCATTQAIRLYNWYDGANLASESRALRVYYDHPDDAKHTEHAIITAPIADRIHGRVCFNGAVWVSPDLRGPRKELGGVFVSQIVSALSRMFALYLFDPDWCIATTPEDHFLKGTSERYGWAGIASPCHVENIGNGDVKVRLMWSRREDMLAEAERIARDGLRAPE